MKKAPDRRVQRTHRLLTEALVELILERGWDAVSVQELCERADVGRATFYTHFADKEDLLVDGLDALGAFVRTQAPISPGSKPLAFARGIIDHAEEQRRLFRAVVGKQSGQIVQNHFRKLVIRLVREDLEHLAPGHPRLDVTVSYVAGAFFELLSYWLESRTDLGPAELENEFHRLTQPVLAVLTEHTPPRSD
jgi:AcrR family transcriptional regulator